MSERTFSQDDEDAEEESDRNDDSEDTKSDNDGDDLTHPNFVNTTTEEEENKEDDDQDKEGEQEEEEDELYRDLNINLERSDAKMTDAQANQDMEDTHVTLTSLPPVVQQQSSSVSSDLVSNFINPSPDSGIDSILNQDTQSDTHINVPVSVAAETPSSNTTIPQPPIPKIQPLQQTPTSTTTNYPTMTLPEISNFASLFKFDQRVFALESEMSKFRQTNSNMKAIIKEQVQAQVFKIMPKIEKYVTESLGAEVLVRSTNQPQTSYAVAASLSEFELKKILIDKMETNKLIDRSDIRKNLYNALVESYNTDKDIITSYGDVVTLKRGRDDQDKDEDPSAGSNRGSKRRRSGKEAESSKEPNNKESKSTSSSKSASKSQSKSSGKSAHAEEHDQKAADLED
ncbi:hypothetical protein Tco_0002830 [Tanacetum coccineum]